MKTDYELIIGAKAKDSESISALYHKYIPLIYKHAHKLKIDSDHKSDYAQDAFLKCLKAIEYVNLSKITNSDTWIFYQVFDWLLQNLDRKYRKVLYHNNAAISLSYFDNEESKEIEHLISYTDDEITKCEIESAKNDFIERLDPIQKTILSMRQNNFTISAIAKKLKVSYGTIHGHIFHAKKLARTIIL